MKRSKDDRERDGLEMLSLLAIVPLSLVLGWIIMPGVVNSAAGWIMERLAALFYWLGL